MNKRWWLMNLTFGYLIFANVVMLITFFYAYFQPDKVIMLGVNKMGEATLEAVFLIVFNVVNIFGIDYISKKIRKPDVVNV